MSSIIFPLYFIQLIIIKSIEGTNFTIINKCDATIWPAILTSGGHTQLNPTGFELHPTQNRSVPAPPGWSGRFWARTGCNFDPSSGRGTCLTGDCLSNRTECNGFGAALSATLAEFTLGGPSNMDFYDVSLVHGFNLPMIIKPSSSGCDSTGCTVDLNRRCPPELTFGNSEACRSACGTFGKPEFCCTGTYACKPTYYSNVFKSACPKAYSYALDDDDTTFGCGGGDYSIIFCPDSTPRYVSYVPPETAAVITSGGNGAACGDDSWLSNFKFGDAVIIFVLFTLSQTIFAQLIAG